MSIQKETLGDDLSANNLTELIKVLAYEGVGVGDIKFITHPDNEWVRRIVARAVRLAGVMDNNQMDEIDTILYNVGMDFGQVKSLLKHAGWKIHHIVPINYGTNHGYGIKACKAIGKIPKEIIYDINIVTPKIKKSENHYVFKNVDIKMRIIETREQRVMENIDEKDLIDILDKPSALFSK